MENDMVNLAFGSLLHDVGKPIQRAGKIKANHSEVGYKFLKDYTKNQEILACVNYHHAKQIKTSEISDDALAYITYIADNMASATDRKTEDSTKKGWDPNVPLADVFDHFGEIAHRRWLSAGAMTERWQDFPSEEPMSFSDQYYKQSTLYFQSALKTISFTEPYLPSLLNLLESYEGNIPSSTDCSQVPDISLYDHSKLTAAFACAIKQYLDTKHETNYRQTLFNKEELFWKEKAFLMIGFSFEGLSDYVFNIVTQGAYRQLRSRAFYCEMLMQRFLDRLMETLGLPQTNILYADSNHAYVLTGNTQNCRDMIRNFVKTFDLFLLNTLGDKLYMTFGEVPCSSDALAKHASQSYATIFAMVDTQSHKDDLQRYDAETLIKLNASHETDGRECHVCHNVTHLPEGRSKCTICEKLETLSDDVIQSDFFIVSCDPKGLPLNDKETLLPVRREDILNGNVNGNIYAKNRFYTGEQQAHYLLVSDYSWALHNNFNLYSTREWTKGKGIHRIGALMIDVDDFYAGFLSGFLHQEEGKYASISRYATLSRRMALFFKRQVGECAKELHVSIIYAQGDSAFILGAWDDVLVLAKTLYQDFNKWTDGKLTFSAGVVMAPGKTPINRIARTAKSLLNHAKISGKNRITLFDQGNTFTFKTYCNQILSDKYKVITDFLDYEKDRGMSFAYKLMQLIRDCRGEHVISFARMAYFLSRLEASAKNKTLFKTFASHIMTWINDLEEMRELEMSLLIYVYKHRSSHE